MLQFFSQKTNLWLAGYIGAGYALYDGALLKYEWGLTSILSASHQVCALTWATAAQGSHLFPVFTKAP